MESFGNGLQKVNFNSKPRARPRGQTTTPGHEASPRAEPAPHPPAPAQRLRPRFEHSEIKTPAKHQHSTSTAPAQHQHSTSTEVASSFSRNGKKKRLVFQIFSFFRSLKTRTQPLCWRCAGAVLVLCWCCAGVLLVVLFQSVQSEDATSVLALCSAVVAVLCWACGRPARAGTSSNTVKRLEIP